MLSFEKNPYSWSEGGNISGAMGSVSLTRQDGSAHPVENLSEEIEVRKLQMCTNFSGAFLLRALDVQDLQYIF